MECGQVSAWSRAVDYEVLQITWNHKFITRIPSHSMPSVRNSDPDNTYVLLSLLFGRLQVLGVTGDYVVVRHTKYMTSHEFRSNKGWGNVHLFLVAEIRVLVDALDRVLVWGLCAFVEIWQGIYANQNNKKHHWRFEPSAVYLASLFPLTGSRKDASPMQASITRASAR